MIPAEKQILRARVLDSLRAIGASERAEKSAKIAAHLADLPGVIFGFAPLRMEPDWLARGLGKEVALPRIEDGRLVFHRVERVEELTRGQFGAREPLADPATLVPPGEAGAVLVPGVAFDRGGGRLGRGGGFYDRFLAGPGVRARRVAVAFACQLVESVPVEPHDARVDAIVTEDGWIETRNNGRDRA